MQWQPLGIVRTAKRVGGDIATGYQNPSLVRVPKVSSFGRIRTVGREKDSLKMCVSETVKRSGYGYLLSEISRIQ